MYCHIHHCHYHHCNCVPKDSKENGKALTQEELLAYTQEMKEELKDYTVDLKDQIFSYIDVGLNPVEIANSINSLKEQDTYILRTLTQKIDELNNSSNLSMYNLRTRVTDLESQGASIINNLADSTERIVELENNLSSLPFKGGVLADTFVTVTSSDYGALPTNLRDVNSELLSVKRFGAKGDGVTDDSAAILAALIASLKRVPSSSGKNKAIYFPAGNYLIKQNNLFGDYAYADYGVANTAKQGVRFYGDSMAASIITLDTSDGIEKWLFNNLGASADRKYKYNDTTFENMTLTTNDADFGNGFKQWSDGQDKRFKFLNCNIYFGNVLHTEGTGNADLNYFVSSIVTATKSLLTLNNPQSVANRMLNCDVTVNGDFVRVYKGGSFWMTGGNLEMHNKSGATVADHYLFNITPTATSGRGNCEFTLRDVRMEVHGANKKLVTTPEANAGQYNITFTEVSMGTVVGGTREAVLAGLGTKVLFKNCIVGRDMTFRAYGEDLSNPFGSLIQFQSCDISTGTALHKLCSVTGNSGRIISDGCHNQVGSVGRFYANTQDFDYGWLSRSTNAVLPKKKMVKFGVISDPIPNVGTGVGLTVNLPKDAYVTKIIVRKAATTGVAGTSYILNVGYSDKSKIFLTTEDAPMTTAAFMEVTDVGFIEDKSLFLWATGASDHSLITMQKVILAYVEYI